MCKIGKPEHKVFEGLHQAPLTTPRKEVYDGN